MDHGIQGAASGIKERAQSPRSVPQEADFLRSESDHLSAEKAFSSASSESEPGSVSHEAKSRLPRVDRLPGKRELRSASSKNGQHFDDHVDGLETERLVSGSGTETERLLNCSGSETERPSNGSGTRTGRPLNGSGTGTERSLAVAPFTPYRPDAPICEEFKRHGYCHNRECRHRHIEQRREHVRNWLLNIGSLSFEPLDLKPA